MTDWQAVVDKSAELANGYLASGIRPTLRQVHYRLVSLQVGGYQNTVNCYKALSRKLVDARKDGLIPWNGLANHMTNEEQITIARAIKRIENANLPIEEQVALKRKELQSTPRAFDTGPELEDLSKSSRKARQTTESR
jgi:hypothetical protein